MFTGLIEVVGTVISHQAKDGGAELRIAAPWHDLVPGESVAIDGACLTVTDSGPQWFSVHVVNTSLERTNFAAYQKGRRVNLERALKVGDRLGGHMVQGHVDGCGTVRQVFDQDDARILDLLAPLSLIEHSIPLGSITVDGVSLTIMALQSENTIRVSIIPFTLQHTTLGERVVGEKVHLEGDMVGKYLRHFVNKPSADESGA